MSWFRILVSLGLLVGLTHAQGYVQGQQNPYQHTPVYRPPNVAGRPPVAPSYYPNNPYNQPNMNAAGVAGAPGAYPYSAQLPVSQGCNCVPPTPAYPPYPPPGGRPPYPGGMYRE